ncbi:hypothetical protein BDN70DRAFT_873141 [Pholiota conissans]|uniref:Uncharacterized protein n=1 Tax=Pholiota conissans TaxID=109636 RepID=A0A9P6D4Z1_9AGAR|nr:hypothetical protein BDN70DRAFT_873141 [Pholiota conissans]
MVGKVMHLSAFGTTRRENRPISFLPRVWGHDRPWLLAPVAFGLGGETKSSGGSTTYRVTPAACYKNLSCKGRFPTTSSLKGFSTCYPALDKGSMYEVPTGPEQPPSNNAETQIYFVDVDTDLGSAVYHCPNEREAFSDRGDNSNKRFTTLVKSSLQQNDGQYAFRARAISENHGGVATDQA